MSAATADVLGTRVYDLGGDDGPALLFSDLHVPADGGPVLDRLDAALAAAVRAAARVFVLGDLFDSYVSPAQLRVGVWQEVARRFAAAADRGIAIAMLHGNRDFLLGAEFERAARVRVVPGGIRCRLAGRTALLLHGDELCQNDLPYQRAKRWLRSPWLRFVARRLPLRLALAAAERARRKSRRVTSAGDPARFDPTVAAMGAAFATGCDLVVFGHVHAAARGRLAAAGRTADYCVLPAFDRDGTGIWAEGGELRYVRAEPGVGCVAVADPPPRAFAS